MGGCWTFSMFFYAGRPANPSKIEWDQIPTHPISDPQVEGSEISWKQQKTSWPFCVFGGWWGWTSSPWWWEARSIDWLPIMGVLRVVRGKCREWLMWMNCKGLTCGRKVFPSDWNRLTPDSSAVEVRTSPWVPKKGIISLIDAKIRENVSKRFFFLMIWMKLEYLS